MKFRSKLLWCLEMENVEFCNPHLRKIIFKIGTQQITRKSENKSTKHRQNLVPRTYRFQKNRNVVSPILTKIIFFQDDSIILLVFSEAFF